MARPVPMGYGVEKGGPIRVSSIFLDYPCRPKKAGSVHHEPSYAEAHAGLLFDAGQGDLLMCFELIVYLTTKYQIVQGIRPLVLFKLGPHDIKQGDKASSKFLVLNFKHFLTPDQAHVLFGIAKQDGEWLEKVFVMFLCYFLSFLH